MNVTKSAVSCGRKGKIRLNDINQKFGASSWLTAIPMKDEGYVPNKKQFWDIIKKRYGWSINRLPINCACGSKFSIDSKIEIESAKKQEIQETMRELTYNKRILVNLSANYYDIRVSTQMPNATKTSISQNVMNVKLKNYWNIEHQK